MGIGSTENDKTKKKRLSLGDIKAARASLCAIMRARYNGAIDSPLSRDLVYGFSKLLGQDKHNLENERIEQLEQLVKGSGNTLIDNKDIDSPYAADLRKQLAEAQDKISGLMDQLLELKRHGQAEG
jgi:hypothetical protein